jgi:hypothetical protein
MLLWEREINMAAVLHILKRDLRASWILLCAMGAFLVLQVLQLCNVLALEYINGRLVLSSELFALVLYLIIMTIVVRVIQEDALVGTSAFWLTRPIARKTLLVAKGLYTLLFLVLVPVAASFVLLFHFGMESAQILPFLLSILYTHLTILCVFIAFAAVTPSWVSFVIAEVVALICLFIANNFWFAISDIPGDIISNLRIFGLLLFAITLCTIVHQYLTRNTRRSVVLLIVGIVCAWSSCHFSLWDSLLRTPLNIQNQENISRIQVVPIIKPRAGIIYSELPASPWELPIMGALTVQNIPDSSAVIFRYLDGRLEFPDGEQLSYHGGVGNSLGVNHMLSTLLPGFEWGYRNNFNPTTQLLRAPKNINEEKIAQAGNYYGKATFDLYQSSIVAEVPLTYGRIPMAPLPDAITEISFQRETGRLWIQADHQGLTMNAYDDDNYTVYLVNRVRRQAFASASNSYSSFITNKQMILFGVDLVHRRWSLEFAGGRAGDSQKIVLDEAWLKDAHLVVIKRNFIGRFTKNFVINNFRIEDYTIGRIELLTWK